jgi:hypothetical protein
LREACGQEVLLISAVTGEGLNQLVRAIDGMLAAQRSEEQ